MLNAVRPLARMSVQQDFDALIFLTITKGVLDVSLHTGNHLLKQAGEALLAILDNFCDIGVGSCILLTKFVASCRPHALMHCNEFIKLILPSQSVQVSTVGYLFTNLVEHFLNHKQRDSCLCHVGPVQTVETISAIDTFLGVNFASLSISYKESQSI